MGTTPTTFPPPYRRWPQSFSDFCSLPPPAPRISATGQSFRSGLAQSCSSTDAWSPEELAASSGLGECRDSSSEKKLITEDSAASKEQCGAETIWRIGDATGSRMWGRNNMWISGHIFRLFPKRKMPIVTCGVRTIGFWLKCDWKIFSHRKFSRTSDRLCIVQSLQCDNVHQLTCPVSSDMLYR